MWVLDYRKVVELGRSFYGSIHNLSCFSDEYITSRINMLLDPNNVEPGRSFYESISNISSLSDEYVNRRISMLNPRKAEFMRSFYGIIPNISYLSDEYIAWRINMYINPNPTSEETLFFKTLRQLSDIKIKPFDLIHLCAAVLNDLFSVSSTLSHIRKLLIKYEIVLCDAAENIVERATLEAVKPIIESGLLRDVIAAFDCLFPSFERFFGLAYKEAFIICDGDLQQGAFRLLETDYKLLLPVNIEICGFVESSDVIHSWAVPSFGIKIDACPGRISRFSITTIRPGIFYGQCFELCGVGHAFMPICVQVF